MFYEMASTKWRGRKGCEEDMSESNPTGRTPDDNLLAEIETRALELARGGGASPRRATSAAT